MPGRSFGKGSLKRKSTKQKKSAEIKEVKGKIIKKIFQPYSLKTLIFKKIMNAMLTANCKVVKIQPISSNKISGIIL